RVASAAAAAGRRRGAGKQDGAHRLGGDAAREGIPAQGYGRLVVHGNACPQIIRIGLRHGPPPPRRESMRKESPLADRFEVLPIQIGGSRFIISSTIVDSCALTVRSADGLREPTAAH